MSRLVDARGRALAFDREPLRLVSLVPSDTFTLARLGAGHAIVGCTEYCVEPAEVVRTIERVGGTKSADVERIRSLAPDLVVANLEENRKLDIERLEAHGVCVYVSFPCTVVEGGEHAATLASLLPSLAPFPVVDEARARVHARSETSTERARVFVPIWMEPLMTVNHATFISDVIERAGGVNVFADRERRYPLAADLGRREAIVRELLGDRDVRYPRVTLEEVAARRPEVVLLPDEPHAFSDADAAIFRDLLPDARIVRCDGRDLMWPGLRATEGLERLARLIAG